MNPAIEVEDVAVLPTLDRARPIISGDNPSLEDLMFAYPNAYVLAPLPEYARLSKDCIVVSTGKRETTVLKKLGYAVTVIPLSVSALLDSFKDINPLSRQVLIINTLPDATDKVQVAQTIALLGETPNNIHTVMSQYESFRGFDFQEAFLQMKLSQCLKIAKTFRDSSIVEVGALLLSGHSIAWALKDSSVGEVCSKTGANSFYVNKIYSFASKYIRTVNFGRATQALTSILTRIQEGQDPQVVLKNTLISVLVN